MAKNAPTNKTKPIRKYKRTSIGRYAKQTNKRKPRTKRSRGQG